MAGNINVTEEQLKAAALQVAEQEFPNPENDQLIAGMQAAFALGAVWARFGSVNPNDKPAPAADAQS